MNKQYNMSAPEIVLGQLIASKQTRSVCLASSHIDESDFDEKWQMKLFNTIFTLHGSDTPFDNQNLQNALEKDKVFRDLQSPAIIYDLPTSASSEEFEKAVRALEASATRKQIGVELDRFDFAISAGQSTNGSGKRIAKLARELDVVAGGSRLEIINIADVQSESVEWLWSNTIPERMVTILDGDPGLGKSTLTTYMAAMVSLGKPLEGDQTSSKPGRVLLVSLEDSVSCVIRPRLEAAGADLNKTSFLDSVSDKGESRPISLPEDFGLLQKEVDRKRPGLIVIDPLMATMSHKVNSYADQDVRRVMGGLKRIAESSGAAIVCVRHLNKSSDMKSLYRGGGSIGIIGSARMGLLVGIDPKDDSIRILAATKSNLGVKPKSRRFKLVSDQSNSVARIEWLGESDCSADDLVTDQNQSISKVDIAVEFLMNLLADGRVPSAEVRTKVKDAGISERSLKDAKDVLNIKSVHDGKNDVWYMEMEQGDQEDRPDPIP